jgi:hypothetical protein
MNEQPPEQPPRVSSLRIALILGSVALLAALSPLLMLRNGSGG